jgi:hypothetical protein
MGYPIAIVPFWGWVVWNLGPIGQSADRPDLSRNAARWSRSQPLQIQAHTCYPSKVVKKFTHSGIRVLGNCAGTDGNERHYVFLLSRFPIDSLS